MDEHKVVLFDTEYKGYRLRARYMKDVPFAYYYIQKDGKYYLSRRVSAYLIYNIVAHFADIVHAEMSTTAFRLTSLPVSGTLIRSVGT